MKYRVNCWKISKETISSQASQECEEGSETRSWSPDRTVKTHERTAPQAGEDIVRTARRRAEAGIKSSAITWSKSNKTTADKLKLTYNVRVT